MEWEGEVRQERNLWFKFLNHETQCCSEDRRSVRQVKPPIVGGVCSISLISVVMVVVGGRMASGLWKTIPGNETRAEWTLRTVPESTLFFVWCCGGETVE